MQFTYFYLLLDLRHLKKISLNNYAKKVINKNNDEGKIIFGLS